MNDLVRFTEDHEWVRVEGNVGTVGITTYAQGELGDIVYIELPEIGNEVEKGAEVAVVESVKAASEVYAPVSGEVVKVNEAIVSKPALVNEDAMGEGWFLVIRLADPEETESLMDETAYHDHVGGGDH